MLRLERRDYGAALGLYRASAARFPLIGAVLLDEQDGVVYADDRTSPKQAYIEHAFGFAQILGEPTVAFEAALERYLLAEKSFTAKKVRLYTPYVLRFLTDHRYEGMRSSRQRFVLNPEAFRTASETAGFVALDETQMTEVSEANIDQVEQVFGLTRRFWRNPADFIGKANAVLLLQGGQPASICYAAALADGEAEIDVFTRPEHQRRGLGKLAVAHFVRRCLDRALVPLWDCFTNNAASIQLSRSIGFTPKGAPYPFFTISR